MQYYAQAKNVEKQIECYYSLEDYAGLETLIATLPDGHSALRKIGDRFTSVGMSAEAVQAYLKSGDVKSAVDSCVRDHHWEVAVQLAESHAYPDIEKVLSQYAAHLLQSGQQLHAVELYRRANQFAEAAKLLTKLAKEAGASRMHPLRAKKLYVMAAMEVDRMRSKMLSTTPATGTQTAAQTLNSLMEQDSATGNDKSLALSWKGAEAYHFLLLAQRQLYNGYPQEAMRTALRLREYEQILSVEEIYSLVALTAFYSKFYGQCSKAFIKLQNAPSLPEAKQEVFKKLALAIFTKYPPADAGVRGISPQELARGAPEACVVSGRPIFDHSETQQCRACKHRYYIAEAREKMLRNCALCHTPLPSGSGVTKLGNIDELPGY